jgi:hypothetical protein
MRSGIRSGRLIERKSQAGGPWADRNQEECLAYIKEVWTDMRR